MAQTVKNLPAMQETCVPSLGGEDALEKGMATHSSILAWEIPLTEEPGVTDSQWGPMPRSRLTQGPGLWGPEGFKAPRPEGAPQWGLPALDGEGEHSSTKSFLARAFPGLDFRLLQMPWPLALPCPAPLSPPLALATPNVCSPFFSGDFTAGEQCGGSDSWTLRPRMAVGARWAEIIRKSSEMRAHGALPSQAGHQGLTFSAPQAFHTSLPAQASSPQG